MYSTNLTKINRAGNMNGIFASITVLLVIIIILRILNTVWYSSSVTSLT